MKRKGLALILVVGVLGVLAVLGSAFAVLSRLERRAAAQRMHATRAWLLARSGLEDAQARLAQGQDPSYGGEDWQSDGDQGAGSFDRQEEVFRPGVLDVDACPVRHALRPSFFKKDALGRPELLRSAGRQRGFSGTLSRDPEMGYVRETYALKVEDLNARVHVNGGALDAADRDPDGPSATAFKYFNYNSTAVGESAPLKPNTVPDFRDPSPEGPNGFLVRLLDNLESVLTGTPSPTLGADILLNRPQGGYARLEDLRSVLGEARYVLFKPFLTVRAWVDPKVVKPQPTDARPWRWHKVDNAHRIGANVTSQGGWLSGCIPAAVTPTGAGTPDMPWTSVLSDTNRIEGTRSYPVSWERQYLYAWMQLRPSPPALEPRAPVSINAASMEVLASALLGLKGTWLESWDGSGGWDGGFSFYAASANPNAPPPPQGTWTYPSEATERTPWIRTRIDYGLGTLSGTNPPYGGSWQPTYNNTRSRFLGDPQVQCAPLGRLRESPPITRDQALAVATEIRSRVRREGRFRTWTEFNAFIDALPVWEDLDGNGRLDGDPYPVTSGSDLYTRRRYQREDLDSNGVLNRQIFTAASGSWVDLLSAPLGAGQVPGLSFVQKDVIKAMANPNTDMNTLNPDANLWKEVDKLGVAGFLRPSPPSASGQEWPVAASRAYVHTTEFALDPPGWFRVRSAGRVGSPGGRLLAQRQATSLPVFELYRDTTQADFLRLFDPSSPAAVANTFTGPQSSPPGTSGGQTLISYPEPQTTAYTSNTFNVSPPAMVKAAYDGLIGLGFNAPDSPPGETLRADFFNTKTPNRNSYVGTAWDWDANFGPGLNPVLIRADDWNSIGNVFPDGIYSEKANALKYFLKNNIPAFGNWTLDFWTKVNWFPEATPRPHALMSLGSGVLADSSAPLGVSVNRVPLDDLLVKPVGLFFVPGRNNATQGQPEPYVHDASSAAGHCWPSRSLLWGTYHSVYMSETLNYRGILRKAQTGSRDWTPPEDPLPGRVRPLGRLEAHRWVHVGLTAANTFPGYGEAPLWIGQSKGDPLGEGGGWFAMSTIVVQGTHAFVNTQPNHIRLGETSMISNMNYVADATYANLRVGLLPDPTWAPVLADPARLGRYYKEDGAAFVSAPLPPGIRPLRVTWTEISCDLWFDGDVPDAWPGSDLDGNGQADPADYRPRNDQFGAGGTAGPNGKRDVRIGLEVWDDLGTSSPSDDRLLGRFDDAGGSNAPARPVGRIRYKAVFVNEWDPDTRLNNPLDVTPYLDDVTVTWTGPGGPRFLDWGQDDE